MNTWTPTARHLLEDHLHGLRPSIAGTGADPDEVLDDLRRHVAEEAQAAGLPVVTEADVRRFLMRVGSPPISLPRRPRAEAIEAAPARAGAAKRNGALVVATAFGVLLPAGALAFELIARVCAEEFFNPLPTAGHVALVALAPLANALALSSRWRSRRWLRALHGAGMAVSLAYAILFLPLVPMALVTAVVGIGLLPLAPWCAWATGFWIRRQPGWAVSSAASRWTRWGAVGALTALIGLSVPTWLTRHFARVAALGEPAATEKALGWLRNWGDRDLLLRDCYGYRANKLAFPFFAALPESAAQRVYYQVAGHPFDSLPAPAAARSRRLRGFFEHTEVGLASDGDVKAHGAARARGLVLAGSRLDAVCDPDAAWAYIEWIMEFRNEDPRHPRAPRAQVQLPPGGVVSRVTLWDGDDEREAAFAGRLEAREAYEGGEVSQARGPVLVMTSGPDRVLVQCQSAPPDGGTIKIRLGITAPLSLAREEEAVLIWPAFAERNFGLAGDLKHGVWVESPQPIPVCPEGWMKTDGEDSGEGIHGQWTDAQLADAKNAIRLRRRAEAREVWAADDFDGKPGFVRQSVSRIEPTPASRVALVVDTSGAMGDAVRDLGDALARAPGTAEFAVFLAGSRVARMDFGRREAAKIGAEIAGLKAEGGQDNVPALLAAWEWAAEAPNSVILWAHAPQPVLLSSTEVLRQRMERRSGPEAPRLFLLPTRPGPNRVAEALSGLEAVTWASRWSGFGEDAQRWFETVAGAAPAFGLTRARVERAVDPGGGEGQFVWTARHVTRLWAAAEARRLFQARRMAEAVALAAGRQLVTPVTGAVVLETAAQFAAAGLKPADPGNVPMVPEPGPGALLALGVGLWLASRGRRRAKGRAHFSREAR